MTSSDQITSVDTIGLSVVIASGAGGDFLPRCLASLRGQAEADGVEVIVVDRCGRETVDRIQKGYPFVTAIYVDQDDRPSVPELRRTGVEHAQGNIVAVIEEHCVAPPKWIETIQSSFQDSDAAIGGPILAKDYERLRDWVVYFSEYHNYLPPWPDGERYQLNGANVAYRREAVEKHQDVLDAGYWEVMLHPLLVREGSFSAVSNMGVYHTGPFDYGYYLRQRYLLSRVWGGGQRSKVSTAKRLLYLLTAPVLPLLLLARITQRVFKNRYHVGKLLACLPLLVPVAVAYVWGEWLGYLLGVGTALEQVE